MQIVNGYICMNCCDVDKARLGQDPHQQTNLIQKQRKQVIEGAASMRLEPAVTFSGALAGTANNGTAGAHGSTPASSAAAERASLDILA